MVSTINTYIRLGVIRMDWILKARKKNANWLEQIVLIRRLPGEACSPHDVNRSAAVAAARRAWGREVGLGGEFAQRDADADVRRALHDFRGGAHSVMPSS